VQRYCIPLPASDKPPTQHCSSQCRSERSDRRRLSYRSLKILSERHPKNISGAWKWPARGDHGRGTMGSEPIVSRPKTAGYVSAVYLHSWFVWAVIQLSRVSPKGGQSAVRWEEAKKGALRGRVTHPPASFLDGALTSVGHGKCGSYFPRKIAF
jgi:hypothetical protein